MKVEKLLKDINGLLKKHEGFLNSNPELFFAIEDRLLKAIDDEDEQEGDENYKDPDDFYNDEDDFESDLLDKPDEDEVPEDDEDAEYAQGSGADDDESEADKWLRENDPARAEQEQAEAPVSQEPSEDEQPVMDLPPEAPKKAEPKERSSKMGDWKPQGQYKPEHDKAIKEHMANGYSHREAERLAGAHKAPTDFYSALRSGTRPSEPSPKMLAQMKELSHGWLRNAERKAGESAEADVNPQKYASGKTLAAHDAAHKDFASDYEKFLGSDDVKGLTGRARNQAVNDWKSKWQEANPEHHDKAVQAAGSGKALAEAGDARKKRLQEGQASLLTAGFSSGEDNPMAGEYSSGAAGESQGKTAAAQNVGAAQSEGDEGQGFSTNIKKDPHAVFAEKNPEYIKHLRTKLQTKMAPEQAERMTAIDSFKKGPK
jgi:hypothetical protein